MTINRERKEVKNVFNCYFFTHLRLRHSLQSERKKVSIGIDGIKKKSRCIR